MAELNRSLAATIDLCWVWEASQLDGLANGSERLINQLCSDLVATSKVSVADPDSKRCKGGGFLVGRAVSEVGADAPASRKSCPVVTVAALVRLVHYAVVNFLPCRVETTYAISSQGRVAIFQERFCKSQK